MVRTLSDLVKWLNLCRKAGAVQAGEQPVRKALALGNAEVVLVATDAGANTRKWTSRLTSPIESGLSKAELGAVFGRGTLSVAAVTNRQLGAKIREVLGGNIIGYDNNQVPPA
ncbi:hypothetical protein FACS1894217_06180 [Clostridia bacterium]|nr:hypothetical protein FACS1894217_06180 [Clostridia bacterium]